MCRYDHYLNYGLILCVFQVYRLLLLPFANTWMLWSLLHKLEIRLSDSVLLTQAALLISCFAFSLRLQTPLLIPVQLLAVCFSATAAARVCPATATTAAVLSCMSGVMCLQLTLSVGMPLLLTRLIEARACRSFVPHVQAKRALFQS